MLYRRVKNFVQVRTPFLYVVGLVRLEVRLEEFFEKLVIGLTLGIKSELFSWLS